MSTFDQSQWADAEFSRDYLDHADHYLPERRRLFQILRSFYRFYFANRSDAKVCDLGCGDGVLAAQVLEPQFSHGIEGDALG